VYVSGTAFIETNGTAADTVFVDGLLNIWNGGTLTVGDAGGARILAVGNSLARRNLQTLAGGRLEMSQAGAEVLVSGGVNFTGGDQTGLLTDGLLSVQTDFNGSGVNSFVASGAHRTRVGGAPVGFNTINDDDGDFRFATLELTDVNISLGRSIVVDTLRQSDAGNLSQTAIGQRITVTGRIEGGESASIDVAHLTLGGAFEHHGIQAIDTLVLNGTAQVMPRFTSLGFPPTYNRVEIRGDVTTDVPPGETLTIAD
jgi:hypothetical protein